MIAEQLPNLNIRKRLAMKPKLEPERSLWPRNNSINRKFKPEKNSSCKKSIKES
jgi:hypothetical protein